MILVCHMISQDQVVKMSFDFMGGISSQKVNFLPSLVTIDIAIVEIWLF